MDSAPSLSDEQVCKLNRVPAVPADPLTEAMNAVFASGPSFDLAPLEVWLSTRHIDRQDAKGLAPMHVFVSVGEPRLIAWARSKGANVNIEDDGKLTPLHYAVNIGLDDCVAELLNASGEGERPDLEARCADAVHYVSRIPIPFFGGRTALHLAASLGSDDIVDMLLQAGASPQAQDNEGLTPIDLARRFVVSEAGHANKLRSLVALSTEPLPSRADIAVKVKDEMLRLQARVTAKSRETQASIQLLRSFVVAEHYSSPNGDLYEPDALLNGCASAELREASMREPVPGVYVFDCLTAEFCSRLLGELRHYESVAAASAGLLPLTRPNSMNNYGLVLNELGFKPAIDGLVERLVAPLAVRYFGTAGQSLADQHSFTIRYEAGGDRALARHVDSSDVTLNICLEAECEGSTLSFFGVRGTDSHRRENVAIVHRAGQAVLHVGRHEHQANPLISGTRTNLIIWARRA